MRFDLNDEQRAVRDAIDELCRARWTPAAVRGHMDGAGGAGELWRELAASGWAGMTVAEEHGGQALGTVELVLACEGMGRALAPGAFFGNAAAALLVEAGGGDDQRTRWLRGFADGSARGALAVEQGDGTALALDADGAAALVLVGAGAVAVAPADSYRLDPVEGVDLTRHLARVELEESEPLPGDTSVAMDRVEVALAAELVGVASRALDMAVEYARTREQFGRPIGAYQAVSHRCADMLLDVESARSAVLVAAWSADNDVAALPFAASVAKVTAAQAAWRVTTSAIQVHGGIGFTWEHDSHLLVRRAVASGHLLGSADWHLDRIATLRALGDSVSP